MYSIIGFSGFLHLRGGISHSLIMSTIDNVRHWCVPVMYSIVWPRGDFFFKSNPLVDFNLSIV